MKVIEVMKSVATSDGDGVKISRVADFSGQHLDPFLMIDELKSDDQADFIGGFPPHPHRGIETFTYMIKGGFEHKDQLGNRKVISSGDVQWMSTGYGVVHSEMPLATEEGMHGFQIWVNMPAKDKLRPAIYQDSVDTPLPVQIDEFGAQLKALAGQWQFAGKTVTSPLTQLSANAAIADLTLPKNSSATLDCQLNEQILVYVHTGKVNGFSAGQLLVIEPRSILELSAQEEAGMLIFTGSRINEQVAHMGPFVMNTQAELRQAIDDYRTGKFGEIPVG